MERRFETRVVHAGDRKPPAAGIPSTTAIVSATSFLYDSAEELDRALVGEGGGDSYSRYGNATTRAFEELLCELEGGVRAHATASGMAALHLALLCALTDRRRKIVAADQLYGQTISMLLQVLQPNDVEVRFADPCDLEGFAAVVREERPGCVLLEPISNPLLRVPALDRLCEVATEVGAMTVVDATFTTPALLRPLQLGADAVVHSVTKYLAGHGDVLGGALVVGPELAGVLRSMARVLGVNLGSFEAYLAMRGVKTLALRMERQCRNAAALADWLAAHPRIERVHYPGRLDHSDHEVACRLLPENRFGGIVSFEVAGAGREQIFAIMDRLQLVLSGTTLGDVHSLILYPTMASHRDLAPRHRARLGIGDNLLRLSPGIEAVEDIRADLEQALSG